MTPHTDSFLPSALAEVLHTTVQPCVFGLLQTPQGTPFAQNSGLWDHALFRYEAPQHAGRIYVALEDGKILSIKAGLVLCVEEGWLVAQHPDYTAYPVLRIARLVDVRGVGHDERLLSMLAYEVSASRLLH